MKNIKTYEGFFDFLNRKGKKKVTLDDIKSCLDDLIDEDRIDNELKYGTSIRGEAIFADDVVVFKKDLFSFADDLSKDKYYSERGFLVRGNALSFSMAYDPSEISDDEVNELLLKCKSMLDIYDCKMSFFIGWGRDEGGTSDKEWSDFKKMVDKVMGNWRTNSIRNITIKIESPNGFIR